MNELVQLVQQKTGLSAEISQQVVDTVVGFIKTKIPAPLASGLDSLLGGSPQANAAAAGAGSDSSSGLMAEAEQLLGGVLGKKES